MTLSNIAFALAAVLAACPLHAQTQASAVPLPAADTMAALQIDIPAQDLTSALRLLAEQTGLQIEVEPSAGSGKSLAVRGRMRAPEALRSLLGSDWTVRFSSKATAVVTSRGPQADAVYTLTPLLVIGERSGTYVTQRTSTATKTDTPLRDVPQTVVVVTRDVIRDQSMQGMSDVVRYVPGATMGQGEGHRDAPTMRGVSSTADFFVDGMRDDAQYYRDVYNVERVEALKGPNALIFGRAGGGGVLNRVTKSATWKSNRSFMLTGGEHDLRRATLDVGNGVTDALALRLAGLFEDSRGFREASDVRRIGLNPTAALRLGERTTARAGFEYFTDDRTVDRGMPSINGRPSSSDVRTFFGNPDSSYATTDVIAASIAAEHALSNTVSVQNRTRYVAYDKFYQNSFTSGAIDASTVRLSAYSNATERRNLFNQSEVTVRAASAGVAHLLLGGVELGRQDTDNYRNTGYYNGDATSIEAPFATPMVTTPIEFRQSATDADNNTQTTVASVYVQDQMDISSRWKAVAGLRYEHFAIDFHNNRTNADLSRSDDMISPRAGLMFKPFEAATLYGSYGVSYLPSSGDQFSSLTATTQTLEPEQFRNYELGAKWDPRPDLSLSVAAYRLDRTNTSAPDPNDATRVVQTGSQRTTGTELSVTGRITSAWQVIGSATSQRARITSATASAPMGAVPALVPERSMSLWNRYQLVHWLAVGAGVINQSDMYAAIDNTVTLPGFTRVDAALFIRAGDHYGVQLNVENVSDARYYPTSHGNNNIMPGAPRSFRVTVFAR